MATLRADEVRIPRSAREAIARHEVVVVMNRERPAYVLLNPESQSRGLPLPPGRPGREVLGLLRTLPAADPEFVEDMEAVLRSVGDVPESPWERS